MLESMTRKRCPYITCMSLFLFFVDDFLFIDYIAHIPLILSDTLLKSLKKDDDAESVGEFGRTSAICQA